MGRGNPRAGVPRGASASAGRGARGKHEDDASTTRRDVVDSQIRFGARFANATDEASSGARVEIAPMPDPSASSAVGTLSEGGTNRGILELTLGSMVALASVALVANGLGRGEPFLDALYEELAGQVSLGGAVPVLKSSVSVAPEPADWARITSEASVAITGFGG